MTTAGFCEVAPESRYTSGRPSNSREKIGKSPRMFSVKSGCPPRARGAPASFACSVAETVIAPPSSSPRRRVRLDVLSRRRELRRYLRAHQLFERLVLQLAQHRLEEALDEQADSRRKIQGTA